MKTNREVSFLKRQSKRLALGVAALCLSADLIIGAGATIDHVHKVAHRLSVGHIRHRVLPSDPMPGLNFYPLRVVATSYCPDANSGPHTATGTHPRRGVAAVDPRVIPLGSVILWNHNVYLAQDTGSVVLGRVVDFWNDRCDDSINWGRKPITILVGRA